MAFFYTYSFGGYYAKTSRANVTCSTDVNFIASQALARSQQQHEDAGANGHDGEVHAGEATDAMEALARQARAPSMFLSHSPSIFGMKTNRYDSWFCCSA